MYFIKTIAEDKQLKLCTYLCTFTLWSTKLQNGIEFPVLRTLGNIVLNKFTPTWLCVINSSLIVEIQITVVRLINFPPSSRTISNLYCKVTKLHNNCLKNKTLGKHKSFPSYSHHTTKHIHLLQTFIYLCLVKLPLPILITRLLGFWDYIFLNSKY